MPDLLEAYEVLLGQWAYDNESTLEDALRLCIERLPAHQVSKYERALDRLREIRGKR